MTSSMRFGGASKLLPTGLAAVAGSSEVERISAERRLQRRRSGEVARSVRSEMTSPAARYPPADPVGGVIPSLPVAVRLLVPDRQFAVQADEGFDIR